ncbi:MAG TPA: hypothetical protein PKE40_03395 [Arachnia sp.]|nr:hypothetical protein [Arachnia sp.]HMT85375.1 hypothetical protein [Arachnia sp.]
MSDNVFDKVRQAAEQLEEAGFSGILRATHGDDVDGVGDLWGLLASAAFSE